ncbi:hypothetical protein EJV47_16845 [Hymenobacter gummosus]|uniref:Uncharacterized protein n=1 Tax=Hymenobacter gummosus TaxID=1776032 RepID=A0A431U0A3_9BACT|nr:hypothetical protein [Hymenobacter gummosus]RTQ48105.1 hypothetical protein EJV47_16845 [Hymenobacter gummosus]
MKPLLYLCLTTALLLGLLRATRRPAAPADVAEQLLRRGILNAAGRAELQRRLRGGELRTEIRNPLTQVSTQWRDNSPAAVLAFCAEAFRQAFIYRTLPPELGPSDVYLGGEALALSDSLSAPARAQRQRVADLLRRFQGDTAAVMREMYRQLPAQYHLEDKIKAEDSVAEGGWTIFPPLASLPRQHWIADGRSTLGKTRTRTARDLHALGLLDDAALRQVLAGIRSGQLRTEADVCQRGSELMQLAATAGPRRAEQRRWLQQLQQAGLLTAAGVQQLSRTDIRHAELLPFEVLAHSPRARILDLRRLPPAPQQLYPVILAQLPALLPGFRPTDVQVEVRRRSMDETLWVDSVVLSFRADGRRYRTAFYQDLARKDGTDTPPLGAKVGYEFRRGVNQWLADQNSPLRLYLATTPDAQSVYGNERLGLVALTARQRPLWGEDGYFLTRESHDNGFSTPRIEALITEAEQLGLLSHLTAAEKAAGRAQVLGGEVTSYAELLRCFPHLLLVIDGESANPPRPYATLTQLLARSSRGGFRPTDIEDGFGDDYPRARTVPFAFRHGGRRYHAELEVKDDWLDDAFFDLIDQALRAPGSAGQFYECLSGEGLIFLTPTQHRHLQRTQPALFRGPEALAGDEEADLPF